MHYGIHVGESVSVYLMFFLKNSHILIYTSRLHQLI